MSEITYDTHYVYKPTPGWKDPELGDCLDELRSIRRHLLRLDIATSQRRRDPEGRQRAKERRAASQRLAQRRKEVPNWPSLKPLPEHYYRLLLGE